jgi:hypothetical protein
LLAVGCAAPVVGRDSTLPRARRPRVTRLNRVDALTVL